MRAERLSIIVDPATPVLDRADGLGKKFLFRRPGHLLSCLSGWQAEACRDLPRPGVDAGDPALPLWMPRVLAGSVRCTGSPTAKSVLPCLVSNRRVAIRKFS